MRGFRKLLLMIAAAAVGILPVASFAEEVFFTAVSVSTAAGRKGDTVDVAVSVSGAVSLDSIQFNLNYDGSALKAVSMTPGTVFTPEFCVVNLDQQDRVSAACVSKYGVEQDGMVLSIRFEVLSDAGSAVTLSDVVATRVVPDGENAYRQLRDVYLTIENGGVQAADGTVPQPKTTPWIAPTPIPTPVPTPEPTKVPVLTAEPELTPEASPVPEPEPEQEESHLAGYLAVGVLSLTIAGIIIFSLVSDSRKIRKKQAGH